MQAAAVLALTLPGTVAVAKTKIACIGASTTSGDGSSPGHHYPDELQRLEGADAEVRNFGASGTTMLRAVSASYWNTTQFTQALAYQPDVAIIWFGGNDAKPENWTAHKGEFLGDYEAMIRMFQALPSHARTYVVLSLLTRDTEGIPKAVVDNEVVPLCRQAAAETGSGVVDVHDDLASHPEYFPDGIHPNDMGTIAVAQLVYAVINATPDAAAPAGDGPLGDATSSEAASRTEAGGGAVPPAPPTSASDAGTALDAPAAMGAPGAAGAGPPPVASGGTGGAPKASGGASHGCGVAGGGEPEAAALLLLVVAALAARRVGRGSRRRRTFPNRERGGEP
jgi:MYXO-CTERM domain-containing protein